MQRYIEDKDTNKQIWLTRLKDTESSVGKAAHEREESQVRGAQKYGLTDVATLG